MFAGSLRFFSAIALICWAVTLSAQPLPALSREALAQHYMQLLMAGNYTELGNYLSEKSTLTDSTAGKSYKGKRQILAFLHRANQGMVQARFEQSQFFVAKKVAVFIGTYHYRGEGSLYGFPEQTIEFSLPMVTILTINVKDQLVTSHQDLFDYAQLKPRTLD
ncbi:nuclear transport factor 2 family protein [Motilimonas eburnea]|uniref:nuclear transport factor 2 family protein n=1 Tax=Motilimonas eburnea TaxID=1737488 RepID=UPI001E4CEC39|nr:nuclear transport factor 2 family protein [Motilimonas eburnea]MCE2570972.1 nuclear transport factor 2 family protein [Motilimonas eburnea]